MRKRLNQPWYFQLAAAAIFVTSVLSTTSSYTQESASKSIQKVVQRGAESSTGGSMLLTKPRAEVPMPGHHHKLSTHTKALLIGLGSGALAAYLLRPHYCKNGSAQVYDGKTYIYSGVNSACPK